MQEIFELVRLCSNIVKWLAKYQYTPLHLVFSFPGAWDSRTFSFPNSREWKQRLDSREIREQRTAVAAPSLCITTATRMADLTAAAAAAC